VFDRDDYFVAVGRESIDLLDRKKLSVIRSAKLPAGEVFDAAPDPSAPRTYVSIGLASDPTHLAQVHEVNEASGRVMAVKGAYAHSLSVDPVGRRIYGGLKAGDMGDDWLVGTRDRPVAAGDSGRLLPETACSWRTSGAPQGRLRRRESTWRRRPRRPPGFRRNLVASFLRTACS
jgi:hypothetical protein